MTDIDGQQATRKAVGYFKTTMGKYILPCIVSVELHNGIWKVVLDITEIFDEKTWRYLVLVSVDGIDKVEQLEAKNGVEK